MELKKNIQVPLEQQKIRLHRQLDQLSGWTKHLRHRHAVKLYKKKMESKVIESNQCSLERLQAILTEVKSEF